MQYCLAIIGCGNMGEALLKGIIDSKVLDRSSIVIYDRDKIRLKFIQATYSVKISGSLAEAAEAKNILLAIKPQNLQDFVEEIKSCSVEGKSIISILAGISTRYFEQKLGEIAVIRVMPNTPALVKKGVFILSRGRYAGSHDLAFARQITAGLGETVVIDEKYQNLATALSGSGPAYFFQFCKYLIDAAAERGMDKKTAKKLVISTMEGSALLVKESSKDLEQLIAMVTSPGGTTERALEQFSSSGMSDIVGKALDSAVKRAFELESLQDS